MQPLKLIIPGKYWDTQLYEGRLYLFGRNGDLTAVNWDKLISEFNVQERLRFAMICAFQRSDLLYQEGAKLLLSDQALRNSISERFDALSRSDLEVSSQVLDQITVGKQSNPFPFPHADSTVYMRNIYSVSKAGVFRATCNKKTKYPISSKPEKKWDAPVLAVDASYSNLALAAGDEGLYELPVGDRWSHPANKQLNKLANLNCADCNWAFYSIYGSSHTGPGYLAAFSMEARGFRQRIRERRLERVIKDEEIFQGKGYSWGSRDKLYQADVGRVRIIRYAPKPIDESGPSATRFDLAGSSFERLGEIQLAAWKGSVISGSVSLFGVVIECENAMVIVPSDGTSLTFEGEPVSWRIFPRSKHYENQLHILYEDRLEVVSFNQDYFVNQVEKRVGTRYFAPQSFRRPLNISPFEDLANS